MGKVQTKDQEQNEINRVWSRSPEMPTLSDVADGPPPFTPATAGKVCVAEVEIMVEVGELDPDQIHTPGIYVDRIVHNPAPSKRIEQRTVRA